MNYKRLIIALLLAFVFASCNSSINSKIIGKWDFNNRYLPNQEKFGLTGNTIEVDNYTNSEFMGSYYVFNGDGTYHALQTEGVEADYIEGNWSFNELDSTLHFKSNSIIQHNVWKVNDLQNGTLVLSEIPSEKIAFNKSYLHKFEEDDETVGTPYDFTKKEMNLWRVKPKKPESTMALKKRITANIDHTLMFLNAHLETGKQTINYSGLSSPFIFATNGLALKRIERADQWTTVFYDYGQAQEAYDILETAFNSHIKVPENLSYVLLQKYLLEELKKQLK